jgi:sensor c-di-GMP phosphodiesterase-like protein
VENAEQGAYLRAQGCEFAQGHYYSRALPSSKIVEHLSTGRAAPAAPAAGGA